MTDVLVYSTDQGRICAECGNPQKKCSCKESKRETIQGNGQVRVRRETAARGGKTVSTISGLALNETELKILTKDLKRTCGTGGTLKNGVIEIQGDHVERLLAELEKRGFQAKRGGG